MSDMKLIMENWKSFEQKQLLIEQTDRILFLLEEGNEDLLMQAMLEEGAVWNFVKNAAKLPEKLVRKVLKKGADYLNNLLKKRGVKRVTRNNVIKTLSSEKNIKLVTATVFALIGLVANAAGVDAVQPIIDILNSGSVSEMYQSVEKLGNAKDLATATMSMPIFGIASMIPGLKNIGYGVQDSTKIKGI